LVLAQEDVEITIMATIATKVKNSNVLFMFSDLGLYNAFFKEIIFIPEPQF